MRNEMGKEGGKSPITLAVMSGNGNTLKKDNDKVKKIYTYIDHQCPNNRYLPDPPYLSV
jgi:hypothetical protein